MALAARAPHNFPPIGGQEPSWDEAIVPVLRQRLQNESHILSKRLSTHSMSGPSDDQSTTVKAGSSRNGRMPQSSTRGPATANGAIQGSNKQTSTNGTSGSSSKSSSIPRKSSEQRQGSISQQPPNSSTAARARTNSTPFSSLPPAAGSTSQAPGGRQSRIPKAARTIGGNGSASSHGGHASISTTASGFHPYRPSGLMANHASTGSLASKGRKPTDQSYMEPPSPSFMEGGTGSEGQLSNSSSLRVPRWNNGNGPGGNGSGKDLRDEEPPFPHSASTSTEFHYEQTRLMHAASSLGPRGGRVHAMEDPRPSNDSADRPYEHWYRGEAARNGGVGELKIGRKEMLDIAQFGHASTNPQRSSPLAFNTAPTGIRRRAESFDAGAGSGRESFENKRESWIMDEKAAGFGKVIDETPLTDLDADEYTTEGERAGYYSNGSMEAAAYKTLYERVGLGIAGSHQDEEMEDAAYEEGDGDTTMVYSTTPKGKSALASRPQASALPATAAPTGKTPLGTNNGATGAKNALLSKPGGPNKPNKANAAAVKGKAAAARGKTLPGAKGDTAADEMGMGQENQGGVPLEKIPYKRPPAKGNWDDIVLPAVAKKLGVEGYALRNEGGAIETIDEEARKRMSMIQPPVPGLFGYDLSKYRPVRPEEDIDMGQQLAIVTEPTPPETPNLVSANVTPPPENEDGRESPLAFSHYQQGLKLVDDKSSRRNSRPPMVVSPPATKEAKGNRKVQKEKNKDGEHSGCCTGCVVM